MGSPQKTITETDSDPRVVKLHSENLSLHFIGKARLCPVVVMLG